MAGNLQVDDGFTFLAEMVFRNNLVIDITKQGFYKTNLIFLSATFIGTVGSIPNVRLP